MIYSVTELKDDPLWCTFPRINATLQASYDWQPPHSWKFYLKLKKNRNLLQSQDSLVFWQCPHLVQQARSALLQWNVDLVFQFWLSFVFKNKHRWHVVKRRKHWDHHDFGSQPPTQPPHPTQRTMTNSILEHSSSLLLCIMTRRTVWREVISCRKTIPTFNLKKKQTYTTDPLH